MSRTVAQLVILAILVGRIFAHVYDMIPEDVEGEIDALIIVVQGWMTHDAYSRGVDGNKVIGTGDGK